MINAAGSVEGRKFQLVVTGVYYGFWNPKGETKTLQMFVQEWFKALAPSWWGPAKESEETSRASSNEAKGLGFYYGAVYVELRPTFPQAELVQKVHLRRRLRGRSFFARVLEQLIFR